MSNVISFTKQGPKMKKLYTILLMATATLCLNAHYPGQPSTDEMNKILIERMTICDKSEDHLIFDCIRDGNIPFTKNLQECMDRKHDLQKAVHQMRIESKEKTDRKKHEQDEFIDGLNLYSKDKDTLNKIIADLRKSR
jgi:hypothetical protein